jgi:phage baseplate assembly protein gpV
VCGLGWTFILSVYAGSAKKYSTPALEEEVCSDPAEQMAMVTQAATEEQYANAPEEVMANDASQAQQDETTSTERRNLASSKV